MRGIFACSHGSSGCCHIRAIFTACLNGTVSRYSPPLLRDVARNGHRLHELTGQLVALEGKVDLLYGSGMKAHFQKARDGAKTLDFLVAREIYKQLERAADAFEDVAIEIDSLVIDHA